MINAVTRRPLQVTVEESGHAYIELPYEHLARLLEALDQAKIHYWVDEETISINDGPEWIFVSLSRRSDPKRVQEILDRLS